MGGRDVWLQGPAHPDQRFNLPRLDNRSGPTQAVPVAAKEDGGHDAVPTHDVDVLQRLIKTSVRNMRRKHLPLAVAAIDAITDDQDRQVVRKTFELVPAP